MDTFFQDYLHRMTDLHQDILDAIQGLTPKALDWIPNQDTSSDMNSINVLITHLCGAERYWIGEVACGDISGRVRAEEFRVSGMDTATLTAKIKGATRYTQSALEALSIGDLAKEGTSPQDSFSSTVGWALLHALEHTATHLGHIQITRQLWEEKK